MTSNASNKFPKSKRLLKHADFQRVYQKGRRQFTGNMTVFFLRRRDGNSARVNEPRVGFTVSKAVGSSVERNRIRRRMRAAVRSSWTVIDGDIDVVFNPRRSVMSLGYTDLLSEVSRGLRVAAQRASYPDAGETLASKAERKS